MFDDKEILFKNEIFSLLNFNQFMFFIEDFMFFATLNYRVAGS